jgi:FdhD protein
VTDIPQPARHVPSIAFRAGGFALGERAVPNETAVAISVNGTTHAVMMATPRNVEDLGLGLALNERIVSHPAEIERMEVAQTEAGIDCRLWLNEARSAGYTARRRMMTGPVGCGLCGVESLELAAPPLPSVAGLGLVVAPDDIADAMEAMNEAQALSRLTRAVHAAGFFVPARGLVVSREDVGRHNALDKVAGHLAQSGVDPASGFVVVTSRVSVELIQKAAVMGAGLLAAVSAPTALGVRTADDAGLTLVAVVRGAEFEIFTHPHRVAGAVEAGRERPDGV